MALPQILNYTFKNSNLWHQAISHPSLYDRNRHDFERLEFLGDRVLGLCVAGFIYDQFPHLNEGELALKQASLVSRPVLANIARNLNVPAAISSKTLINDKILADMIEAIIGAIYIDSSFKEVQQVLWQVYDRLWNLDIQSDAKTKLQEYCQSKSWGLPVYSLLERHGPDHAPQFLMQVTIKSHQAQGTGVSKQKAEMDAAANLLKVLQYANKK